MLPKRCMQHRGDIIIAVQLLVSYTLNGLTFFPSSVTTYHSASPGHQVSYFGSPSHPPFTVCFLHPLSVHLISSPPFPLLPHFSPPSHVENPNPSGKISDYIKSLGAVEFDTLFCHTWGDWPDVFMINQVQHSHIFMWFGLTNSTVKVVLMLLQKLNQSSRFFKIKL